MATVSKRIYIYPYHRVRPDPLPLPGLGFTKDRGDDSETGKRKRFFVSKTLFLVFVRTPSLGPEPSFYDRAFGLLASPTSLEPLCVIGVWSRGQLVFVIVTPSMVSATRGVELTSLASMARVLRSVSSLTGMSEWNPGLSSADGIGIALMWHSIAP